MSLLDSFFGRSRSRSSRAPSPTRTPTTQLRLEPLEERTLLDASSDQIFLLKTFQALVGRPPTPAEADFFISALLQGAGRGRVALEIQSKPEARALVVQALTQRYLLRPATEAAIEAAVADLAAGKRVEDIAARITATDEYFNTRGGGTIDGFLDALYGDALGRPVDPTSRAAFTQSLAAGATRLQVATVIFSSAEYAARFVQEVSFRFVGHAADPTSLVIFVSGLTSGLIDEQVIAAFVSSPEFVAAPPPDDTLSPDEVQHILLRAAAASASEDAIIAVVDRGGRILGVRVEGGVSPAITGNVEQLVFAIDGAVAKARTGAFFGNGGAPLTSRTIQFISQTTMTQREIESNPNVPDPNSPLKGPGFVAPIGLGNHFPPNVPFTPQVDLFAIEHTNRDSIFNPGPNRIRETNPDGTRGGDDIQLLGRFNIDPAFVAPGKELVSPESYGFQSGRFARAQSRGIATLPGGIPIFRASDASQPISLTNPPAIVGGIGVFFPGETGFATEENSALSSDFDPTMPDRSFEAEWIAFAALGGSSGRVTADLMVGPPTDNFKVGALSGVPPLPPGFDLPNGRIDLVGITLDVFGPGGFYGPNRLVQFGGTLGQGNPFSGADQPVDRMGNLYLPGQSVPDGFLVLPHAGPGGLTADDVTRIINQGINQAVQTRAAIRLPFDSPSAMVRAVSDQITGEVLGLFRMPDATIFSIDVAVAKARNVAYYADPFQLQAIDQIPGVPPGTAFTNRTFRYVSLPRFPEGIDGRPPGPFSILNDPGTNPANGLSFGPPPPASAFVSVQGFDAFNPQSNFRDPFFLANQNGIVFFPGSSPLYKGILVGGFGISGDGVDQDDVVTFAGQQGFATPPGVLRADEVFVRGVRLPYQKFNRKPQLG